jgi:hypothetical protein
MEGGLLGDLPEWVSGAPRQSSIPQRDPYADWFEHYLKFRTKAYQVMINEDSLVVTSDINNFYPSIRIETLRELITTRLDIHDSTLNLLIRILMECGVERSYDHLYVRGLPQDPDDNGRRLATFYLRNLDASLNDLGMQGRYGRLNDDMLFSAKSDIEASRVVAMVQSQLESLGLMMNSQKTSVLDKHEYRNEFFPDDNSFLDRFKQDDELRPSEVAYRDRLRTFIRSNRSGQWHQLMRRYYTVGREIGSNALIRGWWKAIASHPELAEDIYEYIHVTEPTPTTCKRIMALIDEEGSVYADVAILGYETLLHMPLRYNAGLMSQITEFAITRLERSGEPRSQHPYICSLNMLLILKFGSHSDIQYIADCIDRPRLSVDSARQAFIILGSTSRYRQLSETIPRRFDDQEIWRYSDLYRTAESDPLTVIRRGKLWLYPWKAKYPRRRIFRIRTYPLLQFIAINHPDKPEVRAILSNSIRQLRSAPNRRHIDWIALRKLNELLRW